MNYENMTFVPSEPVPKLKPGKEQLERLARALYPLVLEYYSDLKKENLSDCYQIERLNEEQLED